MFHRTIVRSLALLACGVLSANAQAELLVRWYVPNEHERFNNSPLFIGQPYDWSGVGRTAPGHWATMVSPHYFLSATHSHPGVGDVITFYGTNDVNGPTQNVTVMSGTAVAGTDIWLGRVDNPTGF